MDNTFDTYAIGLAAHGETDETEMEERHQVDHRLSARHNRMPHMYST